MAASRTLSAKDAAIRAAKYAGSGREVEYRIVGHPGLVLVVQSPRQDGTSTKVWRYTYSNTVNGRRTTRKRKIGVYPVTTLARAIRVAADIRSEVVAGVDVVLVERQAERDQERSDLTFADLAERYFEARRIDALKSLAEIERAIRRDALPVIGHLAPSSIRRQDIEACLAPLADAGRLAMARHLLTYLRGIYNYSLEVRPQLAEDFGIEHNPCDRVGRSTRGSAGAYGKPQVKDRVLDDHEIAAFLAVIDADSHGTSVTVRAIWRALLLTGQRSSEVREMPIGELWLDGEMPIWRLPATRTKNKRPHTVPLVPSVVELLQEQIGRRRSGPVFRARDNPRAYLDERAPGRALERLFDSGLLGVDRFSPHDFRRTVETGMARLGIVQEVRDRVLNHVDGSVGGQHYNRHDYEVETREALERWADHVASLRPAN
jgi:integrase